MDKHIYKNGRINRAWYLWISQKKRKITGLDMFANPSPYQWIGPRENLQEGIVFFQTWLSVLCLLEIAPFKQFWDYTYIYIYILHVWWSNQWKNKKTITGWFLQSKPSKKFEGLRAGDDLRRGSRGAMFFHGSFWSFPWSHDVPCPMIRMVDQWSRVLMLDL